jgi:hypothetical protein
LGCNENGALVAYSLHTIVGPFLLICAAAGDVVHGAADPVETENQLVGLVLVVAAGYTDNVLSVLAIDIDSLGTRSGRVFPTARGPLSALSCLNDIGKGFSE